MKWAPDVSIHRYVAGRVVEPVASYPDPSELRREYPELEDEALELPSVP